MFLEAQLRMNDPEKIDEFNKIVIVDRHRRYQSPWAHA